MPAAAALRCAALLAALLGGRAEVGTVAMWTPDNTSVVGSACGFAAPTLGKLRSPAAQGQYITGRAYCAAMTELYAAGAACGACYALSYKGGLPIVVQVVDEAVGKRYAFECHATVFQEITGRADGFASVTYEQVPCETDGCVTASVMDNPNPSFTKVIFSGLEYPVVAATASVAPAPATAMARVGGAVWSFLHGPGGPVRFSVSNSFGDMLALDDCFASIWPIAVGDSCKICATSTTTTTITRTTTTTASTTTSRTTSRGSSTAVPVAVPAALPDVAGFLDTALPNPFYDVAEVTMDVVAARPLDDEAVERLAAALANATGSPAAQLAGITAMDGGAGGSAGVPGSRGAAPESLSRYRVVWVFGDLSHEETARLRDNLVGADLLGEVNDALADDDDDDDGPDERTHRDPLQIDIASGTDIATRVCLEFLSGVPVTWKLLCCERLFVSDIVHNAGVFLPYHRSFLFAIVLLVALVLLQATRVRRTCCPWQTYGREYERGCIVAPIFVLGFLVNAAVLLSTCVDKFHRVAERCGVDRGIGGRAGTGCPPNAAVIGVEVAFTAIGPLTLSGAFILWWRSVWRSDCSATLQRQRCESPSDTSESDMASEAVSVSTRRHASAPGVTPLAAVLRRNPLLSYLEVRADEDITWTERVLLTAANVLWSYIVVLTSFFVLQRYEKPGKWMAWNPYKLVFESFVAFFVKYVLKKIVQERYLGSSTTLVLAVVACVLGIVVMFFWTSIFQTCYDMGLRSFSRVILVLDITLGAGMINVFTSSVVYSMSIHLFSVYLYEPAFRSRRVHALRLTSGQDVEALQTTYLATQRWRLADKPRIQGRRWQVVDVPGLQQGGLPEAGPRLGDSEGSSASTGEPEDCWTPASCRLGEAGAARSRKHAAVCPTEERPVIVEVERTDIGCLVRVLMRIADKVCSVDPALPLDKACWPLPERRGGCREEGRFSAAPPSSPASSGSSLGPPCCEMRWRRIDSSEDS